MTLALFYDLVKKTVQAWLDDNAARLGAALAFYSILSLSPLLILFLAAASALWGAEAAQGQIVTQMTHLIGKQGAESIQSILAAAASNKYDGFVAAAIGVLSLLFSASAVFGELQDAMNKIWQVKPKQGRPFLTLIRERSLSFAMVVASGFLLIVSLIISAGLAALSYYINDALPFAVIGMHAVNFVFSFAVITAIFALIFKTIPDMVIPWKSVWPGACLTALLFVIGKALIGLYIGRTGVGSSYGAAGSIVILLVWVYYSAQILFFGAEFTFVYSSHFKLHNVEETKTGPV